MCLNIAEGSADNSDAEFARFLGISMRSVYETVAGFDLATLYEYIDEDLNQRIEEKAYSLVKLLANSTPAYSWGHGEMSELAEGARLEIVCAAKSGTEGSNPSLSAIN